jgi:hypothetical protein
MYARNAVIPVGMGMSLLGDGDCDTSQTSPLGRRGIKHEASQRLGYRMVCRNELEALEP